MSTKIKCLTILVALALFFVMASGPALAQTPAAPTMGTAASFAVLAGSAVTNTGDTVVSGELGVWPSLAISGFFPPGVVTNGVLHFGDATAEQAQSDLTIAYDDLAGRPCDVDMSGTDLVGLTLTPGVYCFSSTAFLNGELTLNAEGDPNAVFIFKIGSGLTTGSGASVVSINDANLCNAYWQVGSTATLGTGTAFGGNILALTSIILNDAVSVTGRILARNAEVTLINDDISFARCDEPTSVGVDDFGAGSAGMDWGMWVALAPLSVLGIAWWASRKRPTRAN